MISNAMRAHVDALLKTAKGIVDAAKEQGRDLLESEAAEVTRCCAEVKRLRGDESSDAGAAQQIEREGGLREPFRVNVHFADRYPPGDPRRNQTPSDAEDGSGIVFRDAATGELTRALRSDERFCAEPASDGEPNLVGRAIYSWLTGQPDRGPRALQTGGSLLDGGYLMSPVVSGMVIDLARANSVCMKAGAQTIVMPTNELTIARVDSGPTAYWRPEGSAVTASGVTFGKYTLRSKTLACIIPITLELLEDAPNAAQIVEESIAAAIGAEIDRVCLVGIGSASEPLGVRNTPGINTVSGVGAPTSYAKVAEAVGEILADNYPGELSALSWIAHPVDGEAFAKLCDTTGQPMMPGPWVAPLRKFYTTSCPQDEGSGTDSAMFVGDFAQLLVGVRRSGLTLRRIPAGNVTDSGGVSYNAVDQLLEHLVAHVRIDCCLLRPTWHTVVSGLITS